MPNPRVQAAAEGMPSKLQQERLQAFANATSLVSLACDLLLESTSTEAGEYRMSMEAGEQLTALLLMVRDASKASLGEPAR